MKKGLRVYWQLFWSTFTISACTFGGGYVIVPLMRKTFVEKLHWIQEEEMMDFTAIAQSTPGAMAVNASILVGNRVAGALGTLVAVIGTMIPPFVIIGIISFCYDAFRSNQIVAAVLKGMESGIAAVIIDAVWDMAKGYFKKPLKVPSIVVMAAAFCATWFFDINVAYIIIVSGFAGAVAAVVASKRKEAGL